MGEQRLGQRAGQRRSVELGEVGQPGVEHVVHGLADLGVVAAEREDPEPGQHVEVVLAVVVVEVGSSARV